MNRINFRPLKNLAIAGFFLLILPSCNSPESLKKMVVLKINNDTVTAEEFSLSLAKELQKQEAAFIKDPLTIQRIKTQLTKKLTLKKITQQWAKAHGITVSQASLEEETTKIRSQYPSDIEFRKNLATGNTSFKEWQKGLRFALLEKKVAFELKKNLSPVTDRERRIFYKEHRFLFLLPDRLLLRQIVLNKKNSAERIYRELRSRKSKTTFKELAKKYSVSPEAREEGLVGWIEKPTLPIFDKTFSLPLGRISKIYKSDYGFHIFKVEKKQKARYIPYQEAKERIRKRLLSQREQAHYLFWLEKQIHRSKIYKNDSLIDKLKVSLKGS